MESLETFQVFQDSSLSPDTTPNQMQVLLISLKSLWNLFLWFLSEISPFFSPWHHKFGSDLIILHSTSYQLSAVGLPLFLCRPLTTARAWNLIMPLPWLKSSTTAHSLTSGTIPTVKEAPNTYNVASAHLSRAPAFPLPTHCLPLLLPHFTVCSQLLYNSSVLFCFSLQASHAPKSLCCPNRTHTWVKDPYPCALAPEPQFILFLYNSEQTVSNLRVGTVFHNLNSVPNPAPKYLVDEWMFDEIKLCNALISTSCHLYIHAGYLRTKSISVVINILYKSNLFFPKSTWKYL